MTPQEMIDKRLTIQDGHLKGARITISESLAKELMEEYALQFQQKPIDNKSHPVQFEDCMYDDFDIVSKIPTDPSKVKRYKLTEQKPIKVPDVIEMIALAETYKDRVALTEVIAMEAMSDLCLLIIKRNK